MLSDRAARRPTRLIRIASAGCPFSAWVAHSPRPSGSVRESHRRFRKDHTVLCIQYRSFSYVFHLSFYPRRLSPFLDQISFSLLLRSTSCTSRPFVYFLCLRTSLATVYDAAQPVAGSTIPGFVSFLRFLSSHSLLLSHPYHLHINTPASGLVEGQANWPTSPVRFLSRVCEATVAHLALILIRVLIIST